MTIKMMLGRGIAVLCVTGVVSLAAAGSAPSVADAKDELLAPDAGTVLRAASVPRLAQAGTEIPLRKAAKTKPPEIEALEKAGAPEDVKRSVPASRQARLDRCNKIPECKATLDKIKAAQAGAKPALPLRKASKTKPPGIEAIEKAGAPEDVKRSVPTSRKARFDRCNQIPECKARLDAAKKALGRNSMLSPERGRSLASLLNPFRIAAAQAQELPTLTLTTCKYWQSAAPNFRGVLVSFASKGAGCRHNLLQNFAPSAAGWFTGPLGTDGAPYTLIVVEVPANGYYMINVDAVTKSANMQTNLRHYEQQPDGTWCYCVVKQWTDPTKGRWDHLRLMRLEKGMHYFKFHPTKRSWRSSVRIYEVTVDKFVW